MMKQLILIAALATVLGSGAAWAQQDAGHTAPKAQPNTAPDPTMPTGDLALGSVSLGKAVKADGKPLPAGTYQLRLTSQQATPDAKGQTDAAERTDSRDSPLVATVAGGTRSPCRAARRGGTGSAVASRAEGGVASRRGERRCRAGGG